MDINYYKKYEPIDGKWYITKELGRGAFGTVFEVERRDFGGMKSAMKVITIPSSPSEVDSYKSENFDLDDKSVTSYFYGFVEEFVKEFQLMSKLRGHSNIVSYEDHDIKPHENSIGWDIFIRMELLTPMGEYFANKTPTEQDIIKMGIDMCRALEVCQDNKIIHRDIKPSNIFVSNTGDFKLGDFGVARTLEKTSSGLSKKGTYTYMAPEVFKGEAYNSSVDIYSLGIVMYRLLNNNMEPFRTDRGYADGEAALAKRMNGVEALPKPVNASDRLSAVILKACSYNPADRYASAAEMKKDLENVLAGKDVSADSFEKTVSEATVGINNNVPVQNIPQSQPNPVNVPPVVPAAPVVPPAPPAAKKSKAKLIIALAVVLVAVATAAVYMFMVGGKSDSDKMEDEKSAETVRTEQNVVVPEDASMIEFYPSVELKDKDFDEIEKILRGRVDVLGVDYSLTAGDGKFTLTLPRDFGKTPEMKNSIVEILRSSGAFGIEGYGDLQDISSNIKSISVESSDKNDFVDSLEYVNSYSEEDMLSGKNEDIYYLRIELENTLSESFKSLADLREDSNKGENSDYIMEMEGHFDFGSVFGDVDVTDQNWIEAGKIYVVDKKGEFYLVPIQVASSKNAVKLIEHVITSEKLPCIMEIKILDPAEMETDELSFGKYQESDIEGDYIEIDYKLSLNQFQTDGLYVDAIQTLKNRLDILEEPYAIGYKGYDRMTVMVKISPKSISPDIVRMIIFDNGVQIYSQFGSTFVTCYDMEFKENSSGDYTITVNLRPSYNEEMTKKDLYEDFLFGRSDVTPDTVKPENENIYLVINDVTVSGNKLSALKDDLTLDFENLLFLHKDTISKDEEWLVNLIKHIDEDYAYLPDVDNIYVRYYKDGKFETDNMAEIPWKYEGGDVDEKLVDIVEKHGGEVLKSYIGRTAIDISLDIDNKTGFAADFLETVKEICKEGNLTDGSYSRIKFYDSDAGTKNPGDSAYILITKSLGELDMYGSFEGPTYERYWMDAYDIINKDEFYSAMWW